MIRIVRLIPFFSGQYGGPVNHILELTHSLNRYPINTIIKRTYLKFKDYRITPLLIKDLIRDSKTIDIFHSHGFRSFQEDIGALISLINYFIIDQSSIKLPQISSYLVFSM